MKGHLPRGEMLFASRGKVLILCAPYQSAQIPKPLTTEKRQGNN
jgi:hypothetical protein